MRRALLRLYPCEIQILHRPCGVLPTHKMLHQAALAMVAGPREPLLPAPSGLPSASSVPPARPRRRVRAKSPRGSPQTADCRLYADAAILPALAGTGDRGSGLSNMWPPQRRSSLPRGVLDHILAAAK